VTAGIRRVGGRCIAFPAGRVAMRRHNIIDNAPVRIASISPVSSPWRRLLGRPRKSPPACCEIARSDRIDLQTRGSNCMLEPA
jgi:hypothetical protein